jgi:glutamine synthetase
VNSYKSFSDTPVNKKWGHNNATCAFRVVGQGDDVQIEIACAGSDVQPYLAYAAAIACGLKGVEEKLDLVPVCAETVSAEFGPEGFPRTYEEAVNRFHASAFAREVFTDLVVDHYYNWS